MNKQDEGQQMGLYISQINAEKARFYDQQCVIREHEAQKKAQLKETAGKMTTLCSVLGSIALTLAIPVTLWAFAVTGSHPTLFACGAITVATIFSWGMVADLSRQYPI